MASDLEAILSAGISRLRRMASDTQENLDRLGSPTGTPRSGTPRRRDPSSQIFGNPMLTTRCRSTHRNQMFYFMIRVGKSVRVQTLNYDKYV